MLVKTVNQFLALIILILGLGVNRMYGGDDGAIYFLQKINTGYQVSLLSEREKMMRRNLGSGNVGYNRY